MFDPSPSRLRVIPFTSEPRMPRPTAWLLTLSCVLAPIAVGASIAARRADEGAPRQAGARVIPQCPDAEENPLPLPSSLPPDDFHDTLLAFLQNGDYAKKLHWCVDKGVRDTGPWVYQEYLGTHPAVRV